MSGGITQLVAVGAQDAFLTGDPQVSFFQSMYKRHTNFAQVTHRQVIQGNPTTSGTSVVRFERKGDLLGYVYFVAKQGSAITPWVNFIDKVELLVGGQVIDTHEKEFINTIWPKLGATGDNFTKTLASNESGSATQFMFPLHFFFCDTYSQAIPLVGLQYHDVEVRITWGGNFGVADSFECYANFVYLDDEERRMVADKPRDMLVTQVQKIVPSGSGSQQLVLNHPVKFIAAAGTDPTDTGAPLGTKIRFQVNGVDIGEPKEITPHYNDVSAYYHTFNGGDTTGAPGTGGLFCIPFAINTTKFQPCGTLNFSRIDSARLSIESGSGNFTSNLHAVNYNILRVQNGLGGLLFAN